MPSIPRERSWSISSSPMRRTIRRSTTIAPLSRRLARRGKPRGGLGHERDFRNGRGRGLCRGCAGRARLGERWSGRLVMTGGEWCFGYYCIVAEQWREWHGIGDRVCLSQEDAAERAVWYGRNYPLGDWA